MSGAAVGGAARSAGQLAAAAALGSGTAGSAALPAGALPASAAGRACAAAARLQPGRASPPADRHRHHAGRLPPAQRQDLPGHGLQSHQVRPGLPPAHRQDMPGHELQSHQMRPSLPPAHRQDLPATWGYKATRRRWHACFLLWLVAAEAVSIATMVQMAALFYHRVRITDAFQLGFRQALYEYGDNVSVKTAVDRVQLEGRCCGSALYRDWFRVPWADPEQVNDLRLFTGDKHMKEGVWLVPWAPWSCCNATHLGPCDSLWLQAPHERNDSDVAERERQIGEEMARLLPEGPARGYRDADGRIVSPAQVAAAVQQEQVKVRLKRSPQSAAGPADRNTSAGQNGTRPANRTGAGAGAAPPPAFGAALERLIGTDWFRAAVPADVSLPPQLFVATLNDSARRRRLRRLELSSYSPPQRADVRQRQLNQRGCAQHLSDELLVLLGACYAVLLLVVLCQLAALAGARWLQTSCDLARRWGGDELTAPGYLLFSWPCTLGEGQELQPPPEDPEAIFHMNDEEEDIVGGLGLDGVRDVYNVAQGLRSGDAREALAAVKDTGVLQGTRLEGAADLLSAAAGGGGSGGGGGGDDDDDDRDHGDKDSESDKDSHKHQGKEKRSKGKQKSDKKGNKKKGGKKKSKSKKSRKGKSKRKSKGKKSKRRGGKSSGKRRRKK